jgi:MFS family permease
MNKNQTRLFIATGIGNIFEIFDFFIFIFLSNVIADLFFPHTVRWLAVVFTYTTVTISYMLRPVGALILGNLGDKYGRKSIFSLSILMTAIPSLVIGLSPTYSQIGIWAVVILVISRILQGFSSGAEMPGAVTFIAENYANKNYYFYVAWIPFGANVSIALGAYLIHQMVTSMSKEALYAYGWRIPFLLGSLLAVIGFYIRKNIAESNQFKVALVNHKLAKMPIANLFGQYKNELIVGVLLVMPASMLTSVFHVFLPNLLVKFTWLKFEVATMISSVGALTVAVSIIIFAVLSAWIKPVNIVKLSISGIILLLLIVMCGVFKLENFQNLMAVVVVLSILVGGINGVYWGILVDLFPVQVRYSGVAACFSIASLIGAGLTPLWTSSIMVRTNNYNGIILVCFVISLISLLNTFYLANCLDNKTDKLR